MAKKKARKNENKNVTNQSETDGSAMFFFSLHNIFDICNRKEGNSQ